MPLVGAYGAWPTSGLDDGRREYAWIVSVSVAGALLHYTSAGRIEGHPGRFVNASADLEEHQRRLFGGDEGGLGIEVRWHPAFGVGTLTMIGAHLSGADCEVALVALVDDVGQWDRRRIVLDGTVTDPEAGSAEDLVAWSVRPRLRLDLGVAWPPPHWSVQPVPLSWANAVPDQSVGKTYPVVFGSPGVLRGVDGVATLAVPGAPAIPMDLDIIQASDPEVEDDTTTYDNLLVTAGPAAAESVTLFRRTDAGTMSLIPIGYDSPEIVVKHDSAGVPLTTLSLSSLTVPQSAFVRQAGEYLVAWTDGGGWVPPGASATAPWPLTRLVSQILRLGGIRVDEGGMRSAAPYLDLFELDTYVDDASTAAEWLADHLGSRFPCELVEGQEGVSLVPIRWQATARDAVEALVVGDRGVDRVGSIRESEPRRSADVRVRFGLNLDSNAYQVQVACIDDGSGPPRLDVAIAGENIVYGAQPVAAPPTAEVVELPDVWRISTARAVARYQHWRLGARKRVVGLTVEASRAERMRLGDVVTVTDTDLGLEDAVGLVQGLTDTDLPFRPVEVLLL